MSTLFEMPEGPATVPLSAHREELHRGLSAAVKACEAVPDCYLDVDRAQDLFRALAVDGDTSWARKEIIAAFSMNPGFTAHFDVMNDHVNTMGWAYWRLHRAERRAYGKEGG